MEQLAPRVSSILLMLILALLLSPREVGFYAAFMIAYTFAGAMFDSPARQFSVSVVGTGVGDLFFQRYRRVGPAGGSALLAVVLAALLFTSPSQDRMQIFGLIPGVLVPIMHAWRLEPLAKMQAAAEWPLLAKYQAQGSMSSLVVSLPLLVLTESLLAAAVQLFLNELYFSLRVVRHASRINPTCSKQPVSVEARDFFHLSGFHIAAWAQSQVDRSILLGIAGPARLGLFSMAWSVARTGGDALAGATANVTRPVLLQRSDPRSFDRHIVRAITIGVAIWFLTVVASVVLARILSAEWDPALRAVPVLALSSIPAIASWSLTSALIAAGRVKWATPLKVFTIGMALPIAILATGDLVAASWLIVSREVFTLATMIALTKGVGRRPGILALALLIFLGPLALWACSGLTLG